MSAPPPRHRSRELVAPALVLAGLLLLVALAARARLGDAGGGAAGPGSFLPDAVFSWLYAVFIVLAALAVPFFFFIYTSNTPYSKTQRQRARLLPLWIAVFAVAALVVRSLWGDGLGEALARLGVPGTGLGGDASAGPPRPPAPELGPLVVVSSALVLATAGLVARKALRRRGRRLPGRVADELADALETTLDDLRAERDPRRAIILAYARMERALESCGVPRRLAEAPLEYVARVLLELDVAAEPVHALADLFEQAKFSDHALGPARKAQAIAALERVRTELRETA